MNLISIPGMNEESILNTSTESNGAGLRPFPCYASTWTRQTGCVLKAGIKHFDDSGDNLAIVVCNGQYGGEILINLDCSKVPPGTKDVPKTQQENLETLIKAIKVLGAHTNGKLDPAKLAKARNMCVEFLCKHKGHRQGTDGRWYHKVGYIFKGQVDDIGPVVEVPMPMLPGTAPALVSSGGGLLDDIGF
jgi:hypothetical protein